MFGVRLIGNLSFAEDVPRGLISQILPSFFCNLTRGNEIIGGYGEFPSTFYKKSPDANRCIRGFFYEVCSLMGEDQMERAIALAYLL